SLGLFDGGDDCAAIEIGGEDDKAFLGQPVGSLFDEVVEPPPRVHEEDSRPRLRRFREVGGRLACRVQVYHRSHRVAPFWEWWGTVCPELTRLSRQNRL